MKRILSTDLSARLACQTAGEVRVGWARGQFWHRIRCYGSEHGDCSLFQTGKYEEAAVTGSRHDVYFFQILTLNWNAVLTFWFYHAVGFWRERFNGRNLLVPEPCQRPNYREDHHAQTRTHRSRVPGLSMREAYVGKNNHATSTNGREVFRSQRI